MEQISLFNGKNEFKITKPIRLIELFAGYGSQHFALKYLGVKVESWRICEWAVKSIQAYKDAHCYNNNNDYSKGVSDEFVYKTLFDRGISSNYNEPMTLQQIKRLGGNKARTIFNNILATNNIVNIQKATAKSLGIVDRDKYTYLMTYSFPCQDLSMAGKCAGMTKGGKTRSGMLWEVERILEECNGNLPQVLLMENVPQVHGKKNLQDFNQWREKLEQLGYKNYHKDLNAKNFGIPQNRDRCFMVSVLGDYDYTFPNGQTLELKLKNLLEENVDEKYYLSDKMINYISNDNEKWTGNNNKSLINKSIASTLNTGEGSRRCDASNYISNDFPEDYNLKSKLCNSVIQNKIVKENDVIKHSFTSQIMSGNKKCVEAHNIMPTITTRRDCLGVCVKDYIKTTNKRLLNMLDKIDMNKTQSIDMYNQSTNDIMHTITTRVDKSNETAITQNLRIRKLTPKECFRLMGVKDEDFERIAKNQSNASLYHLAGDSIVINVLMAIFKNMF